METNRRLSATMSHILCVPVATCAIASSIDTCGIAQVSTACESKEAACNGADSCGSGDDCGGDDDDCGGDDDDCGCVCDVLTLPEAQASEACANEQAASNGAHRPSR
eukprot:1692700-Prymnesium_polylepis.1